MLISHLLEKKFSHNGVGYKSSNAYINSRHESEPDRGPHEGKEVAMILDKVKPAGIIEDDVYQRDAKEHVDKGTFISKSFINRLKYKEWVIALPGEEKRVDAIIKLLTLPSTDKGQDNTYHVRLGRLLGYTKEQVKKFLTGNFKT